MRKIIYLPAIVLMMVVSSCATLNIADVRNIDRTRFEPLRLEPKLEANELRIDLIRQSTSVQLNDSTSESHDSPYHPLGFDLGNGMFFDLNGNLSFRIDELLGVSGSDCYTVGQNSRRKQRRADCVYTFCDGQLTVKYPPGRREHYLNHQVTRDNGISVMYRNRLQYAVEFNDQKVVYRGKRLKWDTIHKTDDNRYYLKRGWWRDWYQLEGNRVLLNKDYIVEMSDDNRRIRIISPGWLGRNIRTIEKSGDQIFIYDRRYHGTRIELSGTGLSVYHNRTYANGWSLVE